jgi:hypothetical protein
MMIGPKHVALHAIVSTTRPGADVSEKPASSNKHKMKLADVQIKPEAHNQLWALDTLL